MTKIINVCCAEHKLHTPVILFYLDERTLISFHQYGRMRMVSSLLKLKDNLMWMKSRFGWKKKTIFIYTHNR